MKDFIAVFTIVVVFSGIAMVPDTSLAEPYSSDLTRKWAAQREAQRERARLQEQRNIENKRMREQQMQSLKKIFNIEESQGGTDINSIPERRRPARNVPAEPPANSYADFGNGDHHSIPCPSATDGKVHPYGQPYWGYIPGVLGTEGSSSCMVCQSTYKWVGLDYTHCPGPYPN